MVIESTMLHRRLFFPAKDLAKKLDLSVNSAMSLRSNGTKSELPLARDFCEGSEGVEKEYSRDPSVDRTKPANMSTTGVRPIFLVLLAAVALLASQLRTTTRRMDSVVSDCTSFISHHDGAFDRFGAAKFASIQRNRWLFGYSTRLAANEAMSHLDEIRLEPKDGAMGVHRGDLVLLCVHSIPETGDPTVKTNMEAFTLVDGVSRERFSNGQLLVGVVGSRYAPDAIHGLEHASLDVPNSGKPLVLLGAAGTYGAMDFLFQPKPNDHLDNSPTMTMKSSYQHRVPVSVVPVGRLVRGDGSSFNIREASFRQDWQEEAALKSDLNINTNISSQVALAPAGHDNDGNTIPIFVFTGVAMNSGKSMAMAHFIRGLNRMGLVVGAAKVTGTDYPKDVKYYEEGGAKHTCTFADFGVSSTYNLPDTELDRIVASSIARLTHQGSQVIVLELADGVRSPESRYLLGPKSDILRSRLTSLLVAANSGLSALAVVDEIYRIGLGDKLGGITGVLTSSALAAAEFTEVEAEQRSNRVPTTLVSIQDAANASFCESFLKQWRQPEYGYSVLTQRYRY